MIRIAIVDDDEKLCSKIEQSLIAYRETTAIELDVACHAKRKKLTRKTKKTLLNTTFKSVFYCL